MHHWLRLAEAGRPIYTDSQKMDWSSDYWTGKWINSPHQPQTGNFPHRYSLSRADAHFTLRAHAGLHLQPDGFSVCKVLSWIIVLFFFFFKSLFDCYCTWRPQKFVLKELIDPHNIKVERLFEASTNTSVKYNTYNSEKKFKRSLFCCQDYWATKFWLSSFWPRTVNLNSDF